MSNTMVAREKMLWRRFLNAVNVGLLLYLRDFKYRYRQTFLGYIWAIVKPLLMGIPIIIVGRQFKLGGGTPGVPYEVFTFVGLIFFNVFWDSVVAPQWFMRRTRKLLKNIAFPHEAVIVAGCCQVLFNTSIYLLLIIVVLLLFKVALSLLSFITIFCLPLIMISGLSIGIFIAPSVLIYLDIRYCLPFISQALMWSVPIAYTHPESGILHYVNKWNPLTYLLTAPRGWLFGEIDGRQYLFLLSLLFFACLLLIGFKFFYRAMAIAIDQIL